MGVGVCVGGGGGEEACVTWAFEHHIMEFNVGRSTKRERGVGRVRDPPPPHTHTHTLRRRTRVCVCM